MKLMNPEGETIVKAAYIYWTPKFSTKGGKKWTSFEAMVDNEPVQMHHVVDKPEHMYFTMNGKWYKGAYETDESRRLYTAGFLKNKSGAVKMARSYDVVLDAVVSTKKKKKLKKAICCPDGLCCKNGEPCVNRMNYTGCDGCEVKIASDARRPVLS